MGKTTKRRFDREDGNITWEFRNEAGYLLAYLDHYDERTAHEKWDVTVFYPETERSRQYPRRAASAAFRIAERHLARNGYSSPGAE